MPGAHDRGHEVSAKSRARLLQLAGRTVDLEHGAVGGQAGAQAHRDRRGELTSKRGGAHEHGLGATLLDKPDQPAGMDLGVERGQAVVATAQHLVGAGADEHERRVVACAGPLAEHRHDAAPARRGELARTPHKLERHALDPAVRTRLGDHPDVAVALEVVPARRLVAHDGDGVYGAGVDARPAQDAARGGPRQPVAHLYARASACANAALAAYAALRIDHKTAHRPIPSTI